MNTPPSDSPERVESTNHDEDYSFAHRDSADHPSRAAGIGLVGPDDFDCGKREGSHVDPDGNLIRFGSPLRR